MLPSFNTWHIIALFGLGSVAGVLNVLAGGGSLLTLPFLIFLGLPASMANGTNRVALVLQNVVAVQGFHHRERMPWKMAIICASTAIVGSILGANYALTVSEEAFRRILAAVILGVCLIMILDPAKRWKLAPARLTIPRTIGLMTLFLGIGFYGGFIQAGVGFLMLIVLLLHGLDLVRINAVKVFVVGVFNISALIIFAQAGQVNWTLGLALALGNSVGGWIGTQLAVDKGHDWLRKVVLVVAVGLAVRLFFGQAGAAP